MRHYDKKAALFTGCFSLFINTYNSQHGTEGLNCPYMNRDFTWLTQDETRSLFDVITSKRDKAIFITAYRHGLRASEIGLLRLDELDFKLGRLKIHRKKKSLTAVYPVQPDTLKRIRSYLNTRADTLPYLFPSAHNLPINRRSLWRLMKSYAAKAGIPEEKRDFKILKHSIATHLLDAGAEISFVRDWLGHVNIQNTMVYAQMTNPNRDQQARKVFISSRVV